MTLTETIPSQKALAAQRSYLRSGYTQPSYDMLQRTLEVLEVNPLDTELKVTTATVYMDLATHRRSKASVREDAIDRAGEILEPLQDADITEVPLPDVKHHARAMVYFAFRDMFEIASHDQEPTVEDFSNLHADLLDIDERLKPMATLYPPVSEPVLHEATRQARGVRMEMGVTLLNARADMRADEVIHHARQALPREDKPRWKRTNQGKRGWDIGFSESSFLDRSPHRVQIKTRDNGEVYHPDVTVVTGMGDLGMRYGGEIMDLALKEADPWGDTEAKAHAGRKLNLIEQKLGRRLGWNQ